LTNSLSAAELLEAEVASTPPSGEEEDNAVVDTDEEDTLLKHAFWRLRWPAFLVPVGTADRLNCATLGSMLV